MAGKIISFIDHMLKKSHKSLPGVAMHLLESTPLWQRVPTRTSAGENVCDFMMLIQKFNRQTAKVQEEIVNLLYGILQQYGEVILFADLNVKLNILWVSHIPRAGIGIEVAARIHDAIPEAKLITHHQKHY